MKKPIATKVLIALVGVTTVFGAINEKTEAESLSSLKNQQEKLQNQHSNVKSNLNSTNSKINEIQNKEVDVKTEIKRLDFNINDTTDKIEDKNLKIADTKNQISKLQEEIKIIQKRIEKRNELLKERVRSYQLTGGQLDYLSVLLGANSFSDFIERANAVTTIMEADQDIIKQREADKKELEAKQTKVESELNSLQSMLDELKQMNQQLNSQRTEKNNLLGSLQQQEKAMHEEALALAEQEQILTAQEAAVQKAIKLEKEREEAAARAAAEAKARGENPPPVSNGNWVRPASGTITSGFGYRPEFREGEFHYGIDIANRGDNVPIYAAADGVVIRARYDDSYGNYVIMTHSINGKIYTTVYAHQRKLLVQDGQVVSAGQQIGIMGSTGDSTGQHLHFEVHVGEWVRNTVNAIDPRSLIRF